MGRPPPLLCSTAAVATAAARPAAFFAGLKSELDALGWRHVAALSDDLASLTLAATDAAGRRHELRLALPPGYPATPPTPLADLPVALELRWGPGCGLAAALRQFEAALEQHQQLWGSLDDLDAHAWVIEPSAPTRRWVQARWRATGLHATSSACTLLPVPGWLRTPGEPCTAPCMENSSSGSRAPRCAPSALCSVVHRRIALGSHASLALSLDPAHPGALPTDLRFMGSDASVAPLRWACRWGPGCEGAACSAADASSRPSRHGATPFPTLLSVRGASSCSPCLQAPASHPQAGAARQPGAVARGPHPAGEPGGGAGAVPAAAAGRRRRRRFGRLRHLLRLPPAARGGRHGSDRGGGGGGGRGRAR